MAGEGGRWGLTRIAFGCATLADIAPRQKALLTHDGDRPVFHLDPAVVPVEARPHRAHQGWRYLAEADWPADLRADEDALPPALAAALGRLGL